MPAAATAVAVVFISYLVRCRSPRDRPVMGLRVFRREGLVPALSDGTGTPSPSNLSEICWGLHVSGRPRPAAGGILRCVPDELYAGSFRAAASAANPESVVERIAVWIPSSREVKTRASE
jgi:hypothetical protein